MSQEKQQESETTKRAIGTNDELSELKRFCIQSARIRSRTKKKTAYEACQGKSSAPSEIFYALSARST